MRVEGVGTVQPSQIVEKLEETEEAVPVLRFTQLLVGGGGAPRHKGEVWVRPALPVVGAK